MGTSLSLRNISTRTIVVPDGGSTRLSPQATYTLTRTVAAQYPDLVTALAAMVTARTLLVDGTGSGVDAAAYFSSIMGADGHPDTAEVPFSYDITAETLLPLMRAPVGMRLNSAYLYPTADLAVDAVDYITLTLQNTDTDGTGTTALATAVVTDTTAIEDGTPQALTLNGNAGAITVGQYIALLSEPTDGDALAGTLTGTVFLTFVRAA